VLPGQLQVRLIVRGGGCACDYQHEYTVLAFGGNCVCIFGGYLLCGMAFVNAETLVA
jgi:hypothetical protein